MNTLALELDHRLAVLDPAAATDLEQRVREILARFTPPPAAPADTLRTPTELGYPPGYFEKFAGCFADEPFERPPQLPYETREDW